MTFCLFVCSFFRFSCSFDVCVCVLYRRNNIFILFVSLMLNYKPHDDVENTFFYCRKYKHTYFGIRQNDNNSILMFNCVYSDQYVFNLRIFWGLNQHAVPENETKWENFYRIDKSMAAVRWRWNIFKIKTKAKRIVRIIIYVLYIVARLRLLLPLP